MKIALVTFQDHGAYHQTDVQNEDELLINFLSSEGLLIEKKIWNDSAVIWEQYDLVIIKSPWDYFNLIDSFYQWLEEMEKKKIPLLNPLPIIKWNADKHYLLDIAKKGLKITPSIFLPTGSELSIEQYFNELNTETIIIKPVVSGGSKHTFKIDREDIHTVNEQIKPLLANESFIVQPFLQEIEDEGEWSFIFFGGEFSHAILKKAKPGDFRVQSSFGGTVHSQQPSEELLASAKEYVDHFANSCLYARVDGTITDGEFMLMELELIEPFLFLATEQQSLENYYNALKKLVVL